ncbi:hypothetical protein NHP200010_16050 [Helicobacter bizzozeronii]|uniref:hypothetical protein n=1 Tax=Helicobacter bizzozeronii TaxID=56877 RepID=UPI00244D91EC|nr:hypothetical protein [Helicobacter bizzozeronii]GMB93872.1 hypothetical protein NHP200010_16050 [Helicobacter bizzozeronii]
MLEVQKARKRGRKRGEKRVAVPINKSLGIKVDAPMLAFLKGLENTNSFVRSAIQATPEYQAFISQTHSQTDFNDTQN